MIKKDKQISYKLHGYYYIKIFNFESGFISYRNNNITTLYALYIYIYIYIYIYALYIYVCIMYTIQQCSI